jgi:hypothetical protein
MEDLEEEYVFSIDSLDVDAGFQIEQAEVLDDDDIRLLTPLRDEFDTQTD